MLQDAVLALWFLLPAAIANASPIFAAALPFLKKFDAPIDAGKTLHGHQLLGPHKTWRGIITGIIVATVILWLQQRLYVHVAWARYASDGVPYPQLSLLLGPLFAIGALGGDAVESFFKRQKNIQSGGSWVPFDQLDYIVGSVLVSLLFVRLHWPVYVWIVVVWFAAHLLASFVGYTLKLKSDPI